MFGSKLRSWMENHIVRPRKKGNKNKNAQGSVSQSTSAAVGSGHHDGYKKNVAATGFTIYHHGNGSSTTTTTTAAITTATSITAAAVDGAAASPPSFQASANVSRLNGGHHGANGNGNSGGGSGVISSPVRRREVSPIQSHTQSRFGWQSPDQEAVTLPKSDNFLYAPQHHRVRAPNSKDISGEDKAMSKTRHHQQKHYHHNLLAPQHHNHHQQQQPAQQQLQRQTFDCSSSSFSSLSWSTGSKEPSSLHSSQSQSARHQPPSLRQKVPAIETPTRPPSANDELDKDDDGDVVDYEEIRTILRHPDNISNNNFIDGERPKSEQLTSFTPIARRFSSQDDASARYGRLLPSRMVLQGGPLGSSDSLNGNNHLRAGSAECIRMHGMGMAMNGCGPDRYPRSPKPPARAVGVTAAPMGRIRGNRYLQPVGPIGECSAMAMASVSGGAAPPLHSLSSPESAYSTGYSTDGTSPGAIYTPPEYYINMRTGTHYFPKSVNSLAIEAQRNKFGLNKIEEMSPIDPLPKTSFMNVAGGCEATAAINAVRYLPDGRPPPPWPPGSGSHSASLPQNAIVLPTLKGFECPSPRQRCRIRTNPWYSTTDTSSSGTTITDAKGQPQQQHQQKQRPTSSSLSTMSSSLSAGSSTAATSAAAIKKEVDLVSSASSSGIKSCNEAASSSDRNHGNGSGNSKHKGSKMSYESSESSSSLTEVENMQRTYSPNTIKRRQGNDFQTHNGITATSHGCVGGGTGSGQVCGGVTAAQHLSDDDATLNEMMGKFDESYIYEKETDILSSDSDPTDCPSDMDTGQDAGDECDTDELLDIDFIDTSSMHEVYVGKDLQRNLGSCHYYSGSGGSPTRPPRQSIRDNNRSSMRSRRRSRSLKGNQEIGGAVEGSQRRRKRFMKTRKKSAENKDQQYGSPRRKSRESRSVGGTPVCLRRNATGGGDRDRVYKTSPLTNRSNSLVFSDTHGKRRFMTVADSEKALLRADLEADLKYRQLILEAESILVSMKSSMQSLPRDTPVSSPRRVNPLTNKRVEMLKSGELDTKREYCKQQQQRSSDFASCHAEQDLLSAAINKRLDLIKNESASAPTSPKNNSRLSLRKTHITNFINQNVPPEVSMRRSKPAEAPKAVIWSPPLLSTGRRLQSPADPSSVSRRRFRSQSPQMRLRREPNQEDSDSEQDVGRPESLSHRSNLSLQNFQASREDIANRNFLPEIAKMVLYDQTDYTNRNVLIAGEGEGGGGAMTRYCPQSEPLKRKVYRGSSTYERIQKSFDMETDIPQQALLNKIHNLRRERILHAQLSVSAKSSMHDLLHHGHEPNDDEASVASNVSSKKQLILSTIADLKRSLENQSFELNGLNDN